MSISLQIVIMTVRRDVSYLAQTLASLLLSGGGETRIPDIHLMVGSPDTEYLKPLRHHPRLVLHEMPGGDWEQIRDSSVHRKLSFNFWRALSLDPNGAQATLICEDDIIFENGFMEKLSDAMNEMASHGHAKYVLAVYSPFDSSDNPSRKRGRYYGSVNASHHYGNCCLLFTESARTEAADTIRRLAVDEQTAPADLVLGAYGEQIWQNGTGGMYQTINSLAQHVGFVSGGTSGAYTCSPTFGRPWPAKPEDHSDIAVLIPTYKRAGRVKSVIDNVLQATPNATACIICEPDDSESIAAVEQLTQDDSRCHTRLRLFVPDRPLGSYARAINHAYSELGKCSQAGRGPRYFFCGADDLRFHPGWASAARKQMAGNIRVVGTNDLGNQDVLNGHHATHYLVDRSYIEECSGTADRSFSVLFEGYDHNYTDTEFIATAKARGVFAPCLQAIVEHNHRIYGKSPSDSTYEKGSREFDSDRRLFESRIPLWQEMKKVHQ